jgi:hypothetical protein
MIYQYSWNMCLFINKHMWFTHDRATPYFLRIVRQHLNQAFGERWKGCGGPINWPVLFPDLSTMDLWLWRYLKVLVYLTPINDLELEVVLKCMGTTYSICYRDHTNIAHITAGMGFWTCWLGFFCSFKWILYILKCCNPFLTLCIF